MLTKEALQRGIEIEFGTIHIHICALITTTYTAPNRVKIQVRKNLCNCILTRPYVDAQKGYTTLSFLGWDEEKERNDLLGKYQFGKWH